MSSFFSITPPSMNKYDVFLSFRGEDTRVSFASYLYDALSEKNISTFADFSLQRGDKISSAVLKAIQKSRISLVIFSKNYASSRWCLEELVKIIECREKYNQIVIPVFYDIDPSEVRHQTGPFAEAFKNHEVRFFMSVDKVSKWRDALRQAADLPDFYNLSEFNSEAALTKVIVDEILKKLDEGAIQEKKPDKEVIHDSKITAKWFQRITVEQMFVAICFILELPSAVFDKLALEHKPQYLLVSMVMSLLTMLICIIQLVYQCQKRGDGWKQKAKILWPDLVGLFCVILQSIFTAIDYRLHLRNINDPIALSIWPIIFSFCTMFSMYFKDFTENKASTTTTHSSRASAGLQEDNV